SFGIGYGKSFITKEYSYDTGGYLITSLGGNITISRKFSLVSDLLINTKRRAVAAGLLAARGRFNNFYIEGGITLPRRPFPYLGFGSNILRK
uniref:hypothetical protein n=1 Tax=Aquiflexum sp. TaxID=1872584 RepID=UPI003592F423